MSPSSSTQITDFPTSKHSSSTEFDIIVLDIDGAVTQQQQLLDRYQPQVISMQERHADLRYWCSNQTMESLRQEVAAQIDLTRPRITLYGTNNNHHMAYLWISLLNEPVTVISFDSTSDMFKSVPGYMWAGSWAPVAAKLSHVQKMILLGIDRDFTLDTPENFSVPLGVFTYELDAIVSGKVDIYPNMMQTSKIAGRVRAKTNSLEMQPAGLFTTEIRWNNLRDQGGIRASLEQIVETIPTEAVYFTIDKDGMREADCFSNVYDGKNTMQGTLTVEEVLEIIAIVKAHKRIVGVDICGDYSTPAPSKNRLKQAWTNWEMEFMPPEAIQSIALRQRNEEVNLRILETVLGF